MDLGKSVLQLIRDAASLLVADAAPGWVAAFLFIALFCLAVWLGWGIASRCQALRKLRRRFEQFKDNLDFSINFDSLKAELHTWKARSKALGSLIGAWDQYAETTIIDSRDGQIARRNAVRPSNFLNIDDLRFGPGALRIVPGVFVSLGLLFTFLGLVAALRTLGDELGQGGKPEEVVTRLMTIASAKFVMSLAGLGCSIVFSLALRVGQAVVEREIHDLCDTIEKLLSFVSLEDIGFRQLEAAIEQREAFRKIGMELVADLKRPLNELPTAISASISTAMEPMFDKVSQLGTASMEGIVGDLSSQISSSVGLALSRAGDALTEASERIGTMVDRMNASSTQMGDGMQAALQQMASSIGDLRAQVVATGETASNTMTQGAERLLSVMNETLEGIRDNTAEGATAMRAAAGEMRGAAEGFRAELEAASEKGATAVAQRMGAASEEADRAISGAGRAMLDAFGKTSADIAKAGSDIGDKIGKDVLDRLTTVAARFDELVVAINEGVGGMRGASTSVKSGADAMAGAAVSFGGASRDLIAATDPVRASHERIEINIRELTRATENTTRTLSEGAQSIIQSAELVLKNACQALGTERDGIHRTLEDTRATLAQLGREAEKLEGIDTMLGKALANYSAQLEAALGSAQEHIVRMRETLAPGLDTLRSVVERAEAFVPASRPVDRTSGRSG